MTSNAITKLKSFFTRKYKKQQQPFKANFRQDTRRQFVFLLCFREKRMGEKFDNLCESLTRWKRNKKNTAKDRKKKVKVLKFK